MNLPCSLAFRAAVAGALLSSAPLIAQQPITGQDAYADWSQQKPGAMRKITVADLPAPFATRLFLLPSLCDPGQRIA